MNNFVATLISFAYIILVIGISFVLYKKKVLSSESVRKMIHILVSFWVFILVYCYSSLYWALLGPVSFIFLNAAAVYSGVGKELGMNDRKRDNGLIYYPFSVAVMTIFMYKDVLSPSSVVASTLIMGLGDALAALVGKKIGKHKIRFFSSVKSIEGSAVMATVTFILLLLITEIPLPYMIIISLVLAAVEAITPLGLDNISVPLLSALLIEVFS